MKIFLAQPRGFCAGVDRAIEIVERALVMFGAPVFVRHEIVHNRHVVASLRKKGAEFIDDVHDAPDDSLLIFSAHGVSRDVRKAALARGLHIIDATCPLVTKVHLELIRHAKKGRQIILIGHAGHPEVEGTMGQAEQGIVLLVSTVDDVWKLQVKDEQELAYVTQTTLSIDDTVEVVAALRERFPCIQIPRREDICYATSNRQMAVKELANQCEIVLVIGSQNSSNSQRLCETAKRGGASSWLIDEASQIQKSWLDGISCIGVTAGASAPETLVEDVVAHLQAMGASDIELSSSMQEDIVFRLPIELIEDKQGV